MKKRLLSVLLVISVILSLGMAVRAKAETTGEETNLHNDAYWFYCDVIMEVQESIDAYDWQTEYGSDKPSRPIAVCDIYGDETPELIFLQKADENPYYPVASLTILTYEDHEMKILYSNPVFDSQVGGAMGYYFYQLKGSKKLYAEVIFGTDGVQEWYLAFEEQGDKLVTVELYRHVAKPDYDNIKDAVLPFTHTYYKNEDQAISKTAYEKAIANIEKKTKNILMFTDYSGTSFSKDFIAGHGCNAMTSDEAIRFLCQNHHFYDVQLSSAWFFDPVYEIADTVNEKGTSLMSGYKDGSGNFGPADPLTRQDFAVILYRLANEPAVSTSKKPFPDAVKNSYYYESVCWAKQSGVITGYNNGNFGVGDNITREQVATILFRFAKDYKKMDISEAYEKGDLSKFKDKKAISSFALKALKWANGAGIITGKDNGTRIDPQGNAARAEIAAMVLRFIDYMKD